MASLLSGHQNPLLEYDPNFIDQNTFVKNLKTTRIEIREKIFADRPKRKLKDMLAFDAPIA